MGAPYIYDISRLRVKCERECVLKRMHELVLNKIKNVMLTFFFFLFPVFLMDVTGEKTTTDLKEQD